MRTIISVLLCHIMILSANVLAGSSSLTKYETVNNTGYFDLVVSLDWLPTQTEKDGMLKNAFERFAKDVCIMSEGKQKLRSIYIYTDSKQISTADIQFKNEGGRSNAHCNGIFDSGARILTYTGFSNGNNRTDSYIGHTMAHEFGHYVYGVYDEYSGSLSSSTRPSKPLSGDTTKNTIMNRQDQSQSLSIASDYSDTTKRKTAQWRVFSSSAWETLVRDPKNDSLPNNFTLGYDRVRYNEFSSMTAPTILSKLVSGWDSKFEIVYVETTLAVLIIDKSGSMSSDETPLAMSYTISAAKQFVDLMRIGEKIAVVAFNAYATTLVNITELTDQDAKNQVKASIDTLSAGGDTNFSRPLSSAMSIISTDTTSENTSYVVFMSDGKADMPNINDYKSKKIPIYTIGLGSGINEEVLRKIASETNGTYYAAVTGGDLSTVYAQINRQIIGNQQTLSSGETELLQGETYELETYVSDIDGATTFRASWESGNSMYFELQTPNGELVSPTNYPDNIIYNHEDTYSMFTVDNPETGTWKSIITANTVSINNTVIQEVSTSSVISVNLSLNGGKYPEPIGIMAAVNGPEAVVDATVIASIYPPNSDTSISDVILKDNGSTPDLEKNDGVYSGYFTDYKKDGNYIVSVKVTNPDQIARLDTGGSLEAGIDSSGKALPVFQRISTERISISGYDNYIEPSDPLNATELTTDNKVQWGAIKNSDDIVWYKFLAESDIKYYIQTNNLVSYDENIEMATKITLYETDYTTEIDMNSHYDNSNISLIEWTADNDDYYYIKVESADKETGSFGVSIGSMLRYRAKKIYSNTPPQATTEDDDNGGGTCFIRSMFY